MNDCTGIDVGSQVRFFLWISNLPGLVSDLITTRIGDWRMRRLNAQIRGTICRR